jgi:hypothetical protein
MLRGKIKFALASAGVVGAAIAVPSCASILGIEELAPSTDGGAGSGGSRGGAAGSPAGGSSGASGSSAGGSSGGSQGGSGGAAGSAGASGSGGSAGTGGATGGAAGTPLDGGGGRSGSGGSALDGGDARPPLDAGDSGTLAITVHGTVIDFWRHRVPNVAVYVGTATAMTDNNGQFTINNVTPPYDVGLAVRVGLLQSRGSEDSYLFRGLKRPDPTLQVKDGLVGNSSTGTTWKFQNFPAAPMSDGGAVPRFIGIAFGSPDTMWDDSFQEPDGTDLGASYMDYEGGATSAGTAHALLWETPILDTVSPTRFVAYDAKPLTIDELTTKSVTFNMGGGVVMSDTIAGTLSSAVAGPFQLDSYVRFDDSAPIHVVQIYNAGQNFQMLMPKIAGSSISVSALVGNAPSGPYALAHLDGLMPGQTGVQLVVPAPVSPVAPPGGTGNVGASSMFQWSSSPHVAFFYLDCPGTGADEGPTRFFVVTEDYKTQLPVFTGAGGIPLPKGRECTWSVEVHGAYATVDQATGPTGFLDSFGYYYDGRLWGLKRDSGSFTTSSSYSLTTAP